MEVVRTPVNQIAYAINNAGLGFIGPYYTIYGKAFTFRADGPDAKILSGTILGAVLERPSSSSPDLILKTSLTESDGKQLIGFLRRDGRWYAKYVPTQRYLEGRLPPQATTALNSEYDRLQHRESIESGTFELVID